ncbi:MAG: hypothetical protein HY301_17100 [Verrucomicrobia bacterium]|nr:hypothetical protein [Verrucomicrobiota bacterium]
MKITAKRGTPLPPFETGQVWALAEAELHIGQVGKTLVHYKQFQGKTPRAPVSLTNKIALEKYLQEQKAVLLKRKSAPRAAVRRRS